MPEPARKQANYEDLYRLPPHVTGQIVEGEVHTHPRPHYRHANVEFAIGHQIAPYRFGGAGGPGGWIILIEPEIMLSENLLVPDLAGWKKERLPRPPDANYTTVTPDWICEILSPGTTRLDRVHKMPIYARHEVPYCWLVDPLAKTLEVFGLEAGRWYVIGSYGENDRVRAEPFPAVEINLADFWWED